MKVLIGVDGSPGGFTAAQFVGSLLAPRQDAIALYYAPPRLRRISEEVTASLCDVVFEQARSHLPAPLREQTTTIVGVQRPDHGLLVAADDWRADVIVVGARGTGPLQQPALGSVARNVIYHATVPVLVVRPSADATSNAPLKVLLADDGSSDCRHTAEVLGRFSFPPGSIGQLLTVIEAPLDEHVPAWMSAQLEDQQLAALGFGSFESSEQSRALVREELSRRSVSLPTLFHDQPPLVTVGHAGQEILKVITSEKIHLAVLGARRLGAIDRFLLGSTSQHVVAHAPCSVLIARCHERP